MTQCYLVLRDGITQKVNDYNNKKRFMSIIVRWLPLNTPRTKTTKYRKKGRSPVRNLMWKCSIMITFKINLWKQQLSKLTLNPLILNWMINVHKYLVASINSAAEHHLKKTLKKKNGMEIDEQLRSFLHSEKDPTNF